jgi:hypothetical protein
MPMNRGAAPRDSTRDGGGRAIGLFSSADSHWATCPARQKFGRQAAQPEQPKHRAYFGAAYDRTTDRWHWTISVHTNNHAKEVARSTVTFPTAHDANTAWKTVAEQLKRAEPSRV